MSTLNDIANYVAENVIPGIDWEALEAKWGIPREEVVYHLDPSTEAADGGMFDYIDQILAAKDRAEAQINQIQLSFQVEDNPATAENELQEALVAYKAVRSGVTDVGRSLLQSLEEGAAQVIAGEELHMSRNDYRAFITNMWVTALYGAVAHAEALMQLEDVAPEDIVESADLVCRALNGLAMLGEEGALDPLKPQAAGAVPIGVVVALSVAGVIAVGIIAWMVIAIQKQGSFNKIADLVCTDALVGGDPERLKRCERLAAMNKVALNPPDEPFKGLAMAALMISGAYVLFLSAPHIAKMLGAKTRGKTAAT